MGDLEKNEDGENFIKICDFGQTGQSQTKVRPQGVRPSPLIWGQCGLESVRFSTLTPTTCATTQMTFGSSPRLVRLMGSTGGSWLRHLHSSGTYSQTCSGILMQVWMTPSTLAQIWTSTRFEQPACGSPVNPSSIQTLGQGY